MSDLRFADDVVLTTEDIEQWVNTVNKDSLKIGLNMHGRKIKIMTTISTTDITQIDGTEIET